MRFRANVEDVQTFMRACVRCSFACAADRAAGIMQTVERLSKTCLLRFDERTLRIICDKSGEGGIQVWS